MATMTTPELLDVFKNMTVLELNDFLKAFEEEFGVTAAAPVAVAAAPAAGGGAAGAEAAEEKDEFDVILEAAGDKRIQGIKEIRAIVAGLGLKEAKDLVDGAPKPVLEKASKEDAEKAKAQLEEAGATVSLKSYLPSISRFPYAGDGQLRDVRRKSFHASNAVVASIAATARRVRPA